MTRGYLSLRVDETNRAHHLYVNRGGRADGCWWVAYTLHFGGRKRRIKRSLGTKCLEDAIRQRDALFASIERHGEEVPEIRRKGRRSEELDGERLVPSSRDVSRGHETQYVASA